MCSFALVCWVVYPLPGLRCEEEVTWLRSCLATPDVAQLLPGLHICLQPIYVGLFCMHIYCMSVPFWGRDPSSIALPELSSNFYFLKGCFWEIFLVHIESLRIEGDICYTDCEAP